MEALINNTRVKYECGEVYSFIILGRSKNRKWVLLKGSLDRQGYRRVTIAGVDYYYHRLLYKLHNPEWEIKFTGDNLVDHIDRNKKNNIIANLRVVNSKENSENREAKGYWWCEPRGRYRSEIVVNGKRKCLGSFLKEEEAREAYIIAKRRYHIS